MLNADDDNFDPELDAMLAAARWPEPSPEATPRLRERWRELRNPLERRYVMPIWRLAAAALIVLALGGAWFVVTQGKRATGDLVQSPPLQPSPRVPASRDIASQNRSRIVAQAPTAREMLTILTASPTLDVGTTVREAVRLAAAGDEATATASLRALRTPAVERELALSVASATDHERRRAAVRLLGNVGGRSAFPLLSRIAKDSQLSGDAMPGVARLGGEEALVALVRTAPPEIRAEAIEQLLAMGTDSATSHYLEMVLNHATRADALAALHGSAAPAEKLIASLDDPRVDRRFAAAKALGALCNRPDVSEALRRMVSTNRHRREALAALLSCPGRDAATFIATARTRASVDAEVRAVESELRRIF